VKIAEVFFRKVDPEARERKEPAVTVAVQFRERENLKTCFTFLYDRYLVHPKQKNALRQPWCRLVTFEDFKAKTLGTSLPKAKAASPAAVNKLLINQPTKQQASQAAPKLAPKAAAKAEAKPPGADNFDRQLTPAEAMRGLSGRQLEAFQMVMSRMERLERENQELMQLLIQMQGLLQQTQQRNAQLVGLARAEAVNPATSNTARVALEAHRHAMAPPIPQPPLQAPMPPAMMRPAAPTPITPSTPATPHPTVATSGDIMPDHKRKAAPADDFGEAAANGATDDAEAPWKRQRRRPRRGADEKADGAPGDAGGGDLEGVPSGDTPDASTGLAAYHNALLGV